MAQVNDLLVLGKANFLNEISSSQLLRAFGGIALNESTEQSTALDYVLGIKAFASGGNIVWSTVNNFANVVRLNASGTWGINISGTAAKATADASGNTISSTYAKVKAYNDMIHSTNEYTFASPAYSGAIWINYRTASGATDGNITTYNFGNGKGGTAGVTLVASTFNGNATSASTATNATYLTSQGANVANTRTQAYSQAVIAGGWASDSAGYGSTYGTTLDVSGYSTWYHRLAFHTNGEIDYWQGINTTALTKKGRLLTSANYSSYALPLSGGTVTGTLILSKATDAATTADNSPALIIGGTRTTAHIEIDNNEVLAKSNGTTETDLYLNTTSSKVHIGQSNVGSSTVPIYLAAGVPTVCSGRTVPGIKSASTVTTLGWGTNNNYIADISLLAYWNGAYANTNSNLQYCYRGQFGTIITRDATDYLRYYDSSSEMTSTEVVNTPTYLHTVSTTGGAIATTVKPTGMDNAWGVLHVHTHSGNYATQLGFGGTTGNLYMRNAYNSTAFSAWRTILDSGNWTGIVDGRYVKKTGDTMSGALNMSNNAITGVNNLAFADPGVGEGISWTGGNGWQIQESPDGLTNAAGNLQFVQNSTRRMTIRTDGAVDVPSRLFVGGYNNTSYALSTSSFICNSWIRTTGQTGWYNETYGGGWYMVDTTYVRTYNGKSVYVDNTGNYAFYTAGGFASARGTGALFSSYYNGTWYTDTLYHHGNGNLSIDAPGGNVYVAYFRGNTYFGGSTYYINRSGYFNGNVDMVDGYHANSFLIKNGWWTSSDTSKHVDNLNSGIAFAYTNHGAPNAWGTLVAFTSGGNNNYVFQMHSTGTNYLYFRNKSSDYGQKDWLQVQTTAGYGTGNPTATNYPAGSVYYKLI